MAYTLKKQIGRSMHTYLGIDIGGSGFKFGWGNLQSGLQHFSSLPLKEKSLAGFYAVAEAVLRETDAKFGLHNLSGIGIGTPGTLDSTTGLITGVNPNLPFWVGRSPLELLPEDNPIPVLYDNDANLMALAEANSNSLKTVLGITVGSGIGSGIVVNGKVYHGAHGFAGELGHVCMVEDGLLCNCGRNGCLEAYCSVDGIRNRLVSQSPRFSDITLSQMLSLKTSDSLVRDYITEGMQMLAKSVAGAITCFDPEAVIFGGGAMDLGLYSIAELAVEIMKRLPLANRDRTAIKAAVHGNKAGVIGAIMQFYGEN
jgi:predicted NBD/HSP70 family sugar kinase